MIQDQLVEYINAQMKLGVARDTIKSTLTAAGWVAADVEDTLKKVESGRTAQPSSASPASPASSGPQILKVSDLVSASDVTMSVKPSAASAAMPAKDMSAKSPLTGPAAVKPASSSPAMGASSNMSGLEYPPKKKSSAGTLITGIVLIVVILGLGGFAGFLYMQNNDLSGKLASLNTQSATVASQVSALEAQLAASTTALDAQVSSLTGTSQELQNELSFFAAPSGTAPGATTTVTLGGTLSGGGKLSYVITAMYGAKVYVANSKDINVITALTPLVGTTTQQFSGTYAPGADTITITAVNGTAVQ